VLIWSGLVSPVGGEDRVALPSYDRGVLSEMAQDVLRHATTGRNQSVPESTSAGADAKEEMAVVGSAPDPASPVTHIAPAREGIHVSISPTSSAPKKKLPTSATTGYQSNSWRQRADTARALSFSSGVLAPSSGLDPALKAHADGLRAEGRQFVYGFLLLRSRLDDALERKLAGLGVQLLGPHDDHHKARLPVASLAAIAAMADVEWLGVSAPEQKLSLELTDLRGSQAQAAIVDPATPIPIVVNLFDGDASGHFRQQLEAAGAAVGEYDAGLQFYRAVATGPAIDKIAALDFVLFVEPMELTSPAHDQSTPLIDADMIRPGISFGLTRFSGSSIPVGILDSGFAMGHSDLAGKGACGVNYTDEAGTTFDDLNGHGTHVLATIAGTGSSDSRYRGVAPGVGNIRAAKIWKSDNKGLNSWLQSAMDFMASATLCAGTQVPLVINLSGGQEGTGLTGTDVISRALDDKVFFQRQAYVVAAGNEGPGAQTIRSPGVAKNALTVGNVYDNGYLTVGDVTASSSRGPTGDNRMKPNLVAPGDTVTSALAGTNSYTDKSGTSMATPHVTGLAATLMEHYPSLKFNPALLRAHMMATAIAHGVPGKSNEYGLGRASGYVAHWDHPTTNGWSTSRFSGGVSSQGFQYGDITVPAGTQRLVVVLTWDEPGASAGASRAVTYDLDLWVDYNADCTEPQGYCGEYSSVSSIDNVEYVVVNNPPAGTYRLKVLPYNAPGFALPYGIAATIIRGAPAPPVTAYMTAPSSPVVGSMFGVTLNVSTPSYVASGARVELTSLPPGVTPISVETMRLDGETMDFDALGSLTLGNIVPTLSRSATWFFWANSPGPKTFWTRGAWGNGGEFLVNTTVDVVPRMPDLVVTAVTTNPPAPIRAPGTTFSVTDTVQNAGLAHSDSSKTRFYLSLDAVKSADDMLLTGSRSVHGLDPGSSQSGSATVTIPAATPPNTYFLLACADDLNVIAENNEGNNCIATATAIVTVAKPDLVVTTATTNPPAPIRAPGTTFPVTDTVRNAGPAASGTSTTRYYLSLDGVKSAGDTLLTGSRGIPALAAGASHSGTVTVTIPTATPLNAYFLLACADDLSVVAESNEGNNCIASAAAIVTVTRPDLTQNTVSAPPATKVRGTTFPVTDTVQNVGAVGSAPSTTRYYLSLDAVKSAGDTLLNGSRGVPVLAAGASHSGTVTVTIPAVTPPSTYFLLACADAPNTVVETDETNNCKASSTTVMVTP
jgi:subtilisin family serine protease